MTPKCNKPEVLAPAGSMEALFAAAACGADAVYLGGTAFNARRSAANFTPEALHQAVQYCHLRGMKTYLTLNTLMYDDELESLGEQMALACAAGIDGVIIQDLATAAFLRARAPGLRLHASTQMAVHNLEGMRLLEELGFVRAVLARELSRDEIAYICKNSPLETELFVHGAHCMSVSGQCYLSAMLGTRSANRGMCAQPCRLPFRSETGLEHALSLKDLSLVEHIGEIAELGVCALKIEGRMKRPEYVAAATMACRAAADGEQPDLDALQAVYSRTGFTDGYFTAKRDLSMFGTRRREDVVSAQGVLGELKNAAAKEYPHVGVDLMLGLQTDKPAMLTARDRDGNTVRVTGEPPQTALSKPTTQEMAEKSLGKTGGTFYFARRIEAQLGEGLMLPVSALNALRRDALEGLTALRGKASPIQYMYRTHSVQPRPVQTGAPVLRAVLQRGEQLTPALLEGCALIALPPEELLSLPAALRNQYAHKLMVRAPQIVFGEYPHAQLRQIRALGVTHALAGNAGALWAAREAGFTLHGDFPLNITNSVAVSEYARLGLADATTSIELSLSRFNRLSGGIPLGLAAYGHLPVMAIRNCASKGTGCASCKQGSAILTDRKGIRFASVCADECSYLLNPHLLYLADRLHELSGADFLTLYFTTETPQECDTVLRRYQTGEGGQQGITRGLYYRNVE